PKTGVADHAPAVQTTIRLVLERAGHRVTIAGDGRQALTLFEADQFELLLLDLFMPGMDGLEAMRHIRSRRPAIPVIVISGRSAAPDGQGEPNFLRMATQLGAVASLRKPFRPAVLLEAVDACLRDGGTENPDVGARGQ